MDIEKGPKQRNVPKELEFAVEDLNVAKKLSEAKKESEALREDVKSAEKRVAKLRAELGMPPESEEEEQELI